MSFACRILCQQAREQCSCLVLLLPSRSPCIQTQDADSACGDTHRWVQWCLGPEAPWEALSPSKLWHSPPPCTFRAWFSSLLQFDLSGDTDFRNISRTSVRPQALLTILFNQRESSRDYRIHKNKARSWGSKPSRLKKLGFEIDKRLASNWGKNLHRKPNSSFKS